MIAYFLLIEIPAGSYHQSKIFEIFPHLTLTLSQGRGEEFLQTLIGSLYVQFTHVQFAGDEFGK